jgi:hypothetical protein
MAAAISRQPSHASSTTPWWAPSNLSRASRTRRIAGTSEIFYPSYYFFRFPPFSSTNPATTHDARASVPVGCCSVPHRCSSSSRGGNAVSSQCIRSRGYRNRRNDFRRSAQRRGAPRICGYADGLR